MNTEILILKAYHGDCILIKTFDNSGNEFNILIDSGPKNTFDFSLRTELRKIKIIHLVILTHIDSDHIGGLINFVKNSLFDDIEIQRYWINCRNLIDAAYTTSNISHGEAKNLEELLIEKGEPLIKFENYITTGMKIEPTSGVNFTILSPTIDIINTLNINWKDLNDEHKKMLKPINITGTALSQISKGSLKDLSEEEFTPQKTIERDICNSSSIALLIEGKDFSFLTLGDSRPELVEAELKRLSYNDNNNKLKVDYVKISHHGSKNNTSNDLLDLIECNNFIISTNGGELKSKHPDRETLARILYHSKRNLDEKITIFFNYSLPIIEAKCGKLFTDEELKEGNWTFIDNTNKLPLNDA